ncbi:hypothetical protein [Runella zeae]|uniref:hypothetical protein n=1 Tax=Runella zeae TaxID=94255 RepID=UPI00235650BD|nr:hypothetical protein [Runella zeae]
MALNQIQKQIALRMSIGYALLFFLTIILYFFDGMVEDELISILTTLSSISSLYIAPLIKYLSKDITNTKIEFIKIETNNWKIKLINHIISAHFGVFALFVLLKSLNICSFKEMSIFLLFLETTFGAYMGIVLLELFQLEKK